MNIFLKLKHWHLFTLLFVIPFLMQFVFFKLMLMNIDRKVLYYLLLGLLAIISINLFSWLWTLGTNLHRIAPQKNKLNIRIFKLSVIIPAFDILFFIIILETLFPHFSIPFIINLPIHFFACLCIFYSFYLIAKMLRAAELQRPITFGDFSEYFFLLCFFPIGIWIIQPKINRLFSVDKVTK